MRIKTLTLNNFRAFPGPEPQKFELDGKNLLVYGENGSGKSSIFHALKTFFTLNHPNYIGVAYNVFSGQSDHWIEIEFDDGQAPVRWNGPPIEATWTSDLRVTQAASRRACLDYKSLLDTNYRHTGTDIDLFNIGVEHLLSDFKPIDSPATIGELWQKVKEAFPKSNRDHQVTAAEQACTKFNEAFGAAINALLPMVNSLLPHLSAHGITLIQFVFPSVSYDKPSRSYVGNKLIPKISFNAEIVSQPQDFLNYDIMFI